ncbi:MAG: glutamyl-tRNA reductase [Bacteroidota bacterium]
MLYLLGINHRTADVAVREKIWFSDNEIRTFLPAVKEKFFDECFMISTCNRTELYGVTKSEILDTSVEQLTSELTKEILTTKKASPIVGEKHFYHLKDIFAVNHLFKVATGLDSMILGDVQILNQIRDHYAIAAESKVSGSVMNKLLQSAVHAGKRTKTETEISKGAVSISYAAVDLAAKIFFDLSQKTVLLIGAGETGELTAKHLVARGIGKLLITNRTLKKAEEVAATLNASPVPFESFMSTFSEVDIVISSVGATDYVLNAQQFKNINKGRRQSPLLIIDIGVPRNVDPDINKFENIFLHDLDSLSHIVEQNHARRKSCIPSVNAIMLEELTEFNRWYQSHAIAPTIDRLRELYDTIRQEELDYHIHKFSEKDKETVELVTRRIIHRLIQLPASELRNGKGDTRQQKEAKLQAIRDLFGLYHHSQEQSQHTEKTERAE